MLLGGCPAATASFAVDILPVTDSIERNLATRHVIPDAVRPGLKPPLAYPLAFQLLDLGRGTEWARFEMLDCVEDFRLNRLRESFEIADEARREPNHKAGRHAFSRPGGRVAPSGSRSRRRSSRPGALSRRP